MIRLTKTKQLTIHCLIGLFVTVCSPVAHSITSPANSITTTQSESVDQSFKKARKKESQKKYDSAISIYRQLARKGHDASQIRLANLYYYKKKNYKKAAYWYKKLSQSGNSDAQFHYGNIFRFGLAGGKKYDIARYWYKRAATGNHKHAQYELALMYQRGLGSRKDKLLANKWFSEAAKNGHKQAKSVIRDYNKKAKAKSTNRDYVRTLQKLASQGEADAQFKLSKEYLDGEKITKNEKQAFHWLSKAANNNHASAQYALAMIYFESNSHTKKDHSKARMWLVKAADNQSKKAEKKLNSLADTKQLKQQSRSFEIMLERAINGSVEDQYEIGMRYLLGYKTHPNEQQAIHWVKEAAINGHALAQYQLGNHLLTHSQNEFDLEIAIKYLVLSTKQNILPARSAVKKFYEFGYADLVDATYGDAKAQYKIAQNYLVRDKRDHQQLSVKWLELATIQNHVPSIIALAKLHEAGDIITKNVEQAFNLYLKAAQVDNTVASTTLSELLNQGVGSMENRQIAHQVLARFNNANTAEAGSNLRFTELQ